MAWDSLSHELEHASMAGDAVRGDGRAHSLRRARFARHDLLLLPINRIQCIRKRCALQHQNLCPDFALSCSLLCSRSPSALARARRRRSSLLATDTFFRLSPVNIDDTRCVTACGVCMCRCPALYAPCFSRICICHCKSLLPYACNSATTIITSDKQHGCDAW